MVFCIVSRVMINVGGSGGRREAAIAMDEYCDGIVCWECCVINFDQLGRLKPRHDC